MKKIIAVATALMLAVLACTGCSSSNESKGGTSAATGELSSQETVAEQAQENEYYIFELSDNVERTAVVFQNRYGIELSGDLYVARDLDSVRFSYLVHGQLDSHGDKVRNSTKRNGACSIRKY